MSTYSSRHGHSYRSSSEIRNSSLLTGILVIGATVALAVQIILISSFFNANAERSRKADDCAAAQRHYLDSQTETDIIQKEIDDLNREITKMEEQILNLSDD